jgi:hypothetical protein
MSKPRGELQPHYDQDAPGGPTHQPSVQPGAAHLPVRGQPTAFSGEPVQVLPTMPESASPATAPPSSPAEPVREANHDHRAMTTGAFDQRWLRFSKRLGAALKHDGHELRRRGVRLQLEMPACVRQEGGMVVNAAVTLVRNGLRQTSVAGLHVTELPERRDERSLAGLSDQLIATAAAWLRSGPPHGVLPVFVYP